MGEHSGYRSISHSSRSRLEWQVKSGSVALKLRWVDHSVEDLRFVLFELWCVSEPLCYGVLVDLIIIIVVKSTFFKLMKKKGSTMAQEDDLQL